MGIEQLLTALGLATLSICALVLALYAVGSRQIDSVLRQAKRAPLETQVAGVRSPSYLHHR